MAGILKVEKLYELETKKEENRHQQLRIEAEPNWF